MDEQRVAANDEVDAIERKLNTFLGLVTREEIRFLIEDRRRMSDALAEREAEVAELIECIVGFTGLADLTTGEYMARFGIPDGEMAFANAWDKAMERARAALAAPPPGDGAGGGEAQ